MTTQTTNHSAAAASATDLSAPAPHPLTTAELELLVSDAQSSDTGAAEAAATPTMTPPGQASTAAESAGTGISGQLVTCLYAEQSNRNAWAYLQTAGWKKLSPLTDSGSTVMTLLAAHARAVGHAPVLDENPVGTIDVMYVW